MHQMDWGVYYFLMHETQLKELILKSSDPYSTRSLSWHVHDESLIHKDKWHILNLFILFLVFTLSLL